MASEAVATFREQYPQEHIPAHYRGWLHLAFTFGIGGAVLAGALLQLEAVRPVEWLTVPLAFLYANFAEYWGHRGPMHHLKRGLGLVYERHTRQHHRFFTDGAMALDGGRVIHVPAYPVEPIDTTGAGVSFNAGFLHRWLDGAPLVDCLRLGAACGAPSTLALGELLGIEHVDAAELFELLDFFRIGKRAHHRFERGGRLARHARAHADHLQRGAHLAHCLRAAAAHRGVGGHHARPAGNKHLFLKRGEGLVPDDFRHEVVVAVQERDALVVLTGCSHNGLLNMVETASAEFPGVPVKAVVGGFHLAKLPPFRGMAESERTVADMGRAVLATGIETTWTGHCTGRKAFEVLRAAMVDRVREIHTGSRIDL